MNRSANDLRRLPKPTAAECPGNRLVEFEYEVESEGMRYHIYWEVRPRSSNDAVWLTQVGIQINGGAAGYTSARQSLGPVPGGTGAVGLETDNAFRPGQSVVFAVTGYVRSGGDPHVQFCFEETFRLE